MEIHFFKFFLLLLPFSIHAQVKQISLYPATRWIKTPEINLPLPVLTEPAAKETEIVIHMPLSDYSITSGFGWRRHPVTGKADFHKGVDLTAKDKIVRNMMDGKVIWAGYHKNLGNYVRIDHGTIQSVYGHLSVIIVNVNQAINSGHPIGITGSTGRATGEHLHFAVMSNGVYINPWKYLQGLINKSNK
ncbi:M23 family metallopeptidase [Sphingobacterium hungaricum]|uniref:M23 family peptidase n=1 Tax=Sphingobacterium hungaricum TaxID=2082723 RepID=A0A928V1C0_9SPHI|nr:M23 family metallopeptidase [Sphingobacterium hungaricum]MBE8714849.1 M23 family peptidase [Sphingobacterium hungaricum]